MSKIDEIMGAIGRHGDDCIRSADAASASFEALREMIAAALAEARREGAEAMREAAAMAVDAVVIPGYIESASGRIRDLPLPTGERQAVVLTEVDVIREVCIVGLRIQTPEGAKQLCRAIEAAVFAANNLEVRRG